MVPQVHPELVLPLGCDFVQGVQPCGRQARGCLRSAVTEALIPTHPVRAAAVCARKRFASRLGLQLGLLFAAATPGEIYTVSGPQLKLC